MRKIYIMLLMSSVVLLTACDMLDIQPTGKVIPQTLAEYRALIATAYKNVPDARGLACFRSDELYVKDDSWEHDAIEILPFKGSSLSRSTEVIPTFYFTVTVLFPTIIFYIQFIRTEAV